MDISEQSDADDITGDAFKLRINEMQKGQLWT